MKSFSFKKGIRRGIKCYQGIVRALLIASVLLCGASGWGAATPQEDDDITVTVSDSTAHAQAHSMIQNHMRDTTPASLGMPEPGSYEQRSAAVVQITSQVDLTCICRSNR